jgi:hypothetical protein
LDYGLESGKRLVNLDPKEHIFELMSSGVNRRNTVKEDLHGGICLLILSERLTTNTISGLGGTSSETEWGTRVEHESVGLSVGLLDGAREGGWPCEVGAFGEKDKALIEFG